MAIISGEKDENNDNIAAGRLVFKVNTDTTADTNAGTLTEAMRIDSAGIVTKPLQSGFSVKFSSSSDVSLTSTAYTTIPFNSERWDNNGDFDTSTYTFTAPVTGKYLFNYSLNEISLQAKPCVILDICSCYKYETLFLNDLKIGKNNSSLSLS